MAKPFQQQYGVPQKRNNTPIILAAVAAVAVLGLVAVLAISLGGGGGDKEEASANNAQWRPVVVTGTPLAPAGDAGTPDTAIGTQAPVVTGQTFDGTPLAIDKDGKAQVVVFYAHWCPHCQAELPGIAQWLRNNRAQFPNVEFHAVATGTSPSRPNFPPSAWFKEEGYPLPVLVDDHATPVAQAYGLNSYPYFVVLDKNHNLIARTSGEIGIPEYERLVRQAAAS